MIEMNLEHQMHLSSQIKQAPMLQCTMLPTTIYIDDSTQDSQLTLHIKKVKPQMIVDASATKVEDAVINITPVCGYGADAFCTSEEAQHTRFDYVSGYQKCYINWESTPHLGQGSGRFCMIVQDYDVNMDFEVTFRSHEFRTSAQEGITSLKVESSGMISGEESDAISSVSLCKCHRAKIKTFEVSPRRVLLGQGYDLSWNVTGAARCFVDGNQASMKDSRHFVAEIPAQHDILVQNSEGQIDAASLDSPAIQAPAILHFTCDKSDAQLDEPITLSWEATSANLSITPDIGPLGKELKGSRTINFNGAKRYVLTASGYDGTMPIDVVAELHVAQTRWRKVGEITILNGGILPLATIKGDSRIDQYDGFYYIFAYYYDATYDIYLHLFLRSSDLLNWVPCEEQSRYHIEDLCGSALYGKQFYAYDLTFNQKGLVFNRWDMVSFQRDWDDCYRFSDCSSYTKDWQCFVMGDNPTKPVLVRKCEGSVAAICTGYCTSKGPFCTEMDAIALNGELVLALKDSKNLVSIHRVALKDPIEKSEWTKFTTLSTPIPGWFKLASLGNSIYLITTDGVFASDDDWEKVPGYCPPIPAIPYIGEQDGKLVLLLPSSGGIEDSAAEPDANPTVWLFR